MPKMTLEQLYQAVDNDCKRAEKVFSAKEHKLFLSTLTPKQKVYIERMQLDHIQDLDLIVFEIGCMLGKEDNVT